MSISLIILPIAFEAIAIATDEYAKTIELIIFEFSFVAISI